MASDFDSRDGQMERSHIPLDIDNVHLLLQVEQEQIQKRTFTNWVNAQLAKRRPPCRIVDLFEDFRDGSKLLDLLEVMSGQCISRERGRGMFQHRSNIDKCLAFLKKKSIKLVNINIPDIIDGKPSIILGLIWTIILQYHIEELASSLSFSSRQSSMESLASLDSSLSSRSSSSSPVPPAHTPLHSKFRVSAKKALLLWVREQCHKAGCTINVKDFKASWRSGVVFLAVLSALRPDVVDLNLAKDRSNRQNLEEAFRVAERELKIPRLLEPDDVDVRDPDEKSIMTYVAQFLQYSRDLPTTEEEMQTQFVAPPPKSPSPVNLPAHYTPAISASPLRQANPDRKAQEVTCWLNQAYDELLEGWDSTEGETYSERYHVIQTFLVSFNEQRRPIMPLLTAMRRTPKLSEEQRALRQAWDAVTEKLREYRIELDMTLPEPLNSVARWLLRTEAALAEEEGDPQDHERAAEEAREKQEMLRACLEEMPQQVKTFQTFQNLDEYGNMLVPTDKMDELKRRFTSVRVTAKYHGIKLEYREHRHSVLDLLGQIKTKLRLWRRPYISSEGVRVLLHDWHELVDRQELPSLLEAALYKLKQVSEKYSSKSALASDYNQVIQQVKRLEEETTVKLEEVKSVKSIMGRVLSAWDSYNDCLSSLQAWLQQGSRPHSHEHRAEVSPRSLAEWGSRHAHLNEVGNFLIESTDPQTSRALSEDLRRVNMQWAEFVKRNTFDAGAEPGPDPEFRPQDLQALIREATLILKEPLETMGGPLRTYRKRLQFIMMKIKEVDVDALSPSPECPMEQLLKLKQAVPEVMQTLFEAEQVCAELQHSVSGLDTRLAELLHWETEARDLYKLLKTQERPQRGQDPRARVLISRGLQLEGQVVTEEQDLQLMVMNNQKNSPLQFLHASALQDRVRSVVALSQEAVGMLSSLGSRRERSKSPPEGPPPPKVFIQAKTEPHRVTERETRTTTRTTRTQETFTPKIVVHEGRMEKMPSPPMPYTYAQAVTRTKSPMDAKTQIQTETMLLQKWQTQGQRVTREPQLEEMEIQEQELKTKQVQEVVQPSPVQQAEHKQEEIVERQYVEQAVTVVTGEQQEVVVHVKGLEETAPVKKPLSAQELQTRKAQAMKNRPWLQKAVVGEQKSQATSQDLPQEHIKMEKVLLQEEVVDVVVEMGGETQQPKREKPKQDKVQKGQPQQPKEHQKPPHPVRHMQPQPVPHPELQLQAPVQSQSGQVIQSTVTQVGHIETQVRPLAHSPTKPEQIATQGVELQMQTWGQASPSSPIPMRTPSPSHLQVRSHAQSWAPVRPPSPKMPAQMQPQSQPRMPATSPERGPGQGRIVQDIQIHSQVSQPRPAMQAQMPSQPQPMPQSHVQPMGQQLHIHATSPERGPAQGRTVQDAQIHSQVSQTRPAMQAQMPSQPQPMPQTHVQPMAQQPQHFAQPPPSQQMQQPMAQTSQMQIWMQYRGQSPASMQPQQAPPASQGYPKTYPQQWTQEQQAIQPQRQPVPQQYPQQAPQMQSYQQWVQQGQQGYTPMGYSQQWSQEQVRPTSPMQFGSFGMQQQQTWVQQPSPQPPFPQQQQQYQHYPAPMPPPQMYPPQQPTQAKQHVQMQQNVQQYQPQQPPQVSAQAKVIQPMAQAAKPDLFRQGFPQQQQGAPTKAVDVKPELAAQVISKAPVSMGPQRDSKVMPQTFEAPTKPESSPQQPKVKAEAASPMAPIKFETQVQAEVMPQTAQQLVTQAASKPESSPQQKVKAEMASPAAPVKIETQQKVLHQVKPHTITLAPTKLESPTLPRSQVPSETQPKAQMPTSPQARTQLPPPSVSLPSAQAIPQLVQTSVNIVTQHEVESPESCDFAPALAQAPPQAYTEAYLKAQALARNGFEEAKHCLQEHIMEAIHVFEDKQVTAEQVMAKEETLRTLEPELLEEFLRAAKGMEAFCTPAQLRDMELFTRAVRTQWELCFSADGSFAQAGTHLEALKTLCETLSPEDAHRLAQTQLQECENRLAAIQRQYSGDQDTPLPETRIPVAFSEDVTTQRELPKPSEKPQSSPEVSVKTAPLEKREVEKQVSVEEELTKKEALEKYENCKRLLQAQLAKNEQSIQDVPSDSVSLKGLHTRLQEIQSLRQETEALWSDFISQSALLPPSPGAEQERAELQEQWRLQQQSLQRRGSSLGAALRQIDSTENHMVDFTDRLDRFLRQPKDITGFTLANTNILKDIKDLDDNIQSELDQLSRLDPESSDLDPRDCPPLSREVDTHRTSLDQLRQQVQKSEAAARALDRFLMSLRTVDEDISGVQSAPFSDPTDGRSKLSLIRQSIDSLKDKAPQLDLLLQGARLTVTRDGVPASCLDTVTALLRKLEDVDGSLANQQQSLQKENQSKSLGLRKRALLGELRKLQDTVEMHSLKEPTMPAVQQRLRSLSDLDSQLQSLHSELESLRELQDKQGGGESLLEEVEAQWDETRRALSGRKHQCSVLLDLLKKFQSCRGHLSSTLQRAEQTISDRASYMGKDNLRKCIAKVNEIKEELGGLRVPLEDLRAVCRQIQSHLKKIPDCNQTSFEAEAESLMDNWLDVTEKTDAYMDNLKVALELWDKQLMMGTEVDSWAGAKLALFAASHPFYNEQQVLAMRDDINKNEENVEHFHRKSVEIQEMLQSQEAPLELQVIETQLRKRMEQVKELFTDCTDVFEELMAVKKHLTEKIEECQMAVENLQSSLTKCDASKPDAETQLQDLCEDLEAQEVQAESVLKEVSLVSSVASPQALEALSVDCSRLRDSINRTKEMIHLKREERDKGLLKVLQDERQSFEDWFQDLQLSVNECFENPESTANVETVIQRLTGFLKSTDPERRLDQLRDQLDRGQRQVPSEQLTEISEFIREQQDEVDTFRTHCENRLKQMEELLSLLHSLQKQHNSFSEWLQMKEKQSVEPERVRNLLKELQDASVRATSLSDLLASVRKQGVRGDALLKDTDNLLQRFRNLQNRLQDQAQNQDQLQEKLNRFKSQTEDTRKWIKELLQPLSSGQRESHPEEVRHRAESILKSKPEGDSRLTELRLQSQSLLDQEDLDQRQRHEVQQCIRETEESWRTALDSAEEGLRMAETRVQLDRDLGDFRDQTDSVQSWISEQEEQLQTLRLLPVQERVQVALSCLSSKPKGDSLVQDLKRQGQTLSENQALDDSRRRSVQEAVRQTEEQWSQVSQATEEALNAAESEAAVQREYEAFKDHWGKLQSWIREQKQKIMSITGHVAFEERLQLAQAALSCKPEGDSKIRELEQQARRLVDNLDVSRRPEVESMVRDTEQQWKSALQAAQQAELRSLSDDFDHQSKTAQNWIRERQQQLQSVSSQTPPNERIHTAQTVLSSKPDGDCKVNNLRRRGQTLCDHQDVSESRRDQVQQTVRDTEEQWRAVQQNAKQMQTTAENQVAQETESRLQQLREFDSQKEETCLWLKNLQQRLNSLQEQPTAEDRLHMAQAILSSKPEGDSKLQELKRRSQSLRPDFDEQTKSDIYRAAEDAEEQWSRLLQSVRLVLEQSERQCALENQLRDYNNLKERTTAWIQEKVESLGVKADPEHTINTAQMILSSKPEGDSKLFDLRRQTQSLLDRDDVDKEKRREAEQVMTEAEYQWRDILQNAEDTLSRAEVQYTVHREMDVFRAQARGTKSWVKDLQQQLEAKGSGAKGSQAEIEERLSAAQMVLSCRLNGDSQLTELKGRAQSLSENTNLDEDQRRDVQRTVTDTEQQWREVLQTAEDTQRQLQGVLERLVSYNVLRSELVSRLSELKNQTSSLPRLFPWPGLGERRQAADQARTMIDQTSALVPMLTDARKQAAELAEVTQDPSWTSTNWDEMEQSIPALLKELTEALSFLEEGILTERQCTQLMEQHEAAQDWLREQVKGLGPAPTDKQGLHSTINTLRALLQTVHREQKEMKELDEARESLLNLCTPGGQDALTLDVSHLHDLCMSSEQEVKQHLTSCEARLEEMDKHEAQRTQGLKEKTSALQWELRSLDQALSYSQPQNNIAQLQQHWHSLKNCEKSLNDLKVKLDELLQEVTSAPETEELLTEITTVVKSLSQQHESLKSRLRDHQMSCSTNTSRCFKDCLQNLQQWNSRETPESSDSLQESLEEGEKYKLELQEALSHCQFLSDCLSPNVFEKLDQESSKIVSEAETQKNALHKKKEEIDARPLASSEAAVVAPPRKHKRSPEKKAQMTPSGSIQSIDKSVDEEEKLMVEAYVVEPVVCYKAIRMQAPPEEFIIKQEIEAETETFVQSEKAVVDTKEVMQQTTQVVSQETPVPLRRKSKTAASEPEAKHMKIEVEITDSTQPETSDSKRISTITLEEPQSFMVPGEITSKVEKTVVIEQVKTIVEDLDKAETGSFPDVAPAKMDTLEAVVPKRKPKSPKLPPKQMELESPAETSDTVLVPARRKSKTTPPTEISLDKDSEKPQEASVQETAKLSPTKRRSKKIKSSPEIAPKEVEMGDGREETKPLELVEAKVDQEIVQEQKEIVEELKLVAPKRKCNIVDLPQKTFETEAAETRRTIITEIYTSTESVNVPEVSENGKISPPKRKPKSPKSSPAIVKKDATKEEAKQETQSISSVLELDLQTTSLPPAELDKPVTAKPSIISDAPTEKLVGENGSLSPTKRRSKGRPKISPELPKKEPEEAKDEAETVASPIESTTVESGSISPPKRKSKKAKVSPELSKKEVQEAKIQAAAQEIVVESVGSFSPTKRKSKSKKSELQDSSVWEWSPMEVQMDDSDSIQQTKKVATIILEMPDTVPQMVLEETISKPSVQQDVTTEEAVVAMDSEQTPTKEAGVAQKVQIQTTTETVSCVRKTLVEFDNTGEIEEKKVATVILEMPVFAPSTVSQPQVKEELDISKAIDAMDTDKDTEKAKVVEELKVLEDVCKQMQEPQMTTEEKHVPLKDEITAKDIIPICEPLVHIDSRATEEKKVAIVVLEMPDLPKTVTESEEKKSNMQPTKEETAEQYARPEENIAEITRQEITKMDMQPIKADVEGIIPVCEMAKDRIEFIGGMQEIEERKVATILLEMPDSEPSAVSQRVLEEAQLLQEEKEVVAPYLCFESVQTQTVTRAEEKDLETQPELKPQEDVVAVVEPQLGPMQDQQEVPTPVLEMVESVPSTIIESEQKDLETQPELTTEEAEVAVVEPQLEPIQKDAREKIETSLMTIGEASEMTRQEITKIDIQPIKADVEEIIPVCEMAKDQMEFISGMQEIEESKISTIILEMPDSEPSAVSQRVLEEAQLLQEEKEVVAPYLCFESVQTQTVMRAEEKDLETQPELKPQEDVVAVVEPQLGPMQDQHEVPTPVLEMVESVPPTIIESEQKDLETQPELTTEEAEVAVGEPQLEPIQKDAREKIETSLMTTGEASEMTRQETTKIDIQPIKADVEEIILVCEMAKDRVEFIGGMQDIQESKIGEPQLVPMQKDMGEKMETTLTTIEDAIVTQKETIPTTQEEIRPVCVKISDGIDEADTTKDATTVEISEQMDLSEPTTKEGAISMDTKKDIEKPKPSLDQEQDRKDVVEDVSTPLQAPKTEAKEVVLSQEVETLVDGKTIHVMLERTEVILQPDQTTREVSASVATIKKSGLPSNQEEDVEDVLKPMPVTQTESQEVVLHQEVQIQTRTEEISPVCQTTVDQEQDLKDVVEELSKPIQVTQTESTEVVLPKDVKATVDSISPAHEKTVVGEEETIQVMLERSEQIILQPDQTTKDDREGRKDTELLQQLEPPSDQKQDVVCIDNVLKQVQAPHTVYQEKAVPQKVETPVGDVNVVSETITLMHKDSEVKQIQEDTVAVDSLKMPKTLQVNENVTQPDKNVETKAVVCIKETKEVQKEQVKSDLSAEPKMTPESEKIEVSISDSQPLEETVVAEETTVEYVSIVRKTTAQGEATEERQEDKMAAKKSDTGAEVSSGMLQMETPETIEIDLTTSTLFPQIEDVGPTIKVPPQNTVNLKLKK